MTDYGWPALNILIQPLQIKALPVPKGNGKRLCRASGGCVSRCVLWGYFDRLLMVSSLVRLLAVVPK